MSKTHSQILVERMAHFDTAAAKQLDSLLTTLFRAVVERDKALMALENIAEGLVQIQCLDAPLGICERSCDVVHGCAACRANTTALSYITDIGEQRR